MPRPVILVAPAEGSGGVGDYAADICRALEARGVQVTRLETGGPGGDTVRSIVSLRRNLRRTLAALGPGAIVHLEMSAASIAPLWALSSRQDVVTATVHDPPHLAWWPARTRLVHRSRVAVHALHYPLARTWWAIEQRRARRMQLIALSRMGCESLSSARHVMQLPHYVPMRSSVAPAEGRPPGVGLFGQMYGGKGFERLAELRRSLPADVSLHVAGRGTEAFPQTEGVHVWGSVDGEREAAFFASIRLLLLPYDAGGRYGPSHSASGASARAYAFGTPVAATAVRSFPEEAEHGGLVLVPSDTRPMAEAVIAFIRDPIRVRTAAEATRRLAATRRPSMVADQMIHIWGLLSVEAAAA
jgi:glycosyltransferase involved in cell wall biosynthesis